MSPSPTSSIRVERQQYHPVQNRPAPVKQRKTSKVRFYIGIILFVQGTFIFFFRNSIPDVFGIGIILQWADIYCPLTMAIGVYLIMRNMRDRRKPPHQMQFRRE